MREIYQLDTKYIYMLRREPIFEIDWNTELDNLIRVHDGSLLMSLGKTSNEYTQYLLLSTLQITWARAVHVISKCKIINQNG